MLKLILVCSSVTALVVGFVLCTATITQSHPYRTNTSNFNGVGYYGNGARSQYSVRPYQRQVQNTFTPDYVRQINTPSLYGNMVMPTPNQFNNRGFYGGQSQDYTPRNNVSPYFNPSTGSYYGKGAARYDGQAQQAPNYYYPNNQVQGGVYVSPSRTVITINGGAVNCYNCRNRPNTRFYR